MKTRHEGIIYLKIWTRQIVFLMMGQVPYLTLDNGLRVLLVSDGDEAKDDEVD